MYPLRRNMKRYISFKATIAGLLAAVVFICAGFAAYSSMAREVVINDNGKVTRVKTVMTSVSDVLREHGIKVGADDLVSVPLNMNLQTTKNEIYVKRAVPVSVYADGKRVSIMSAGETVGQAMEKAKVKLNEKDKLIGTTLKDKVVPNMNLVIVRVLEQVVKRDEKIPYKVVKKENDKLEYGKQNVLQEGQDGVKEITEKLEYEDGYLLRKSTVNNKVTKPAMDRIIETGTLNMMRTDRGDEFEYSTVLNMRATAYTSSFKDTNKSPGDPEFGITYTGIRAKPGVIAVDPDVIPLGSRVYVECIGRNDYGYAIAADIGSAIQGDLIDLYMDNQHDVDAWGCNRVRVYFVKNRHTNKSE